MSEAVRNDPDFGPILGGMIGDSTGTSRFDESTLIAHALNAPVIERKPEMNELPCGMKSQLCVIT
jgi:hypothetical protein